MKFSLRNFICILVLILKATESKKKHHMQKRRVCGRSDCEAPRIKVNPKNITWSQGEKGFLKCRASGNPVPTITWEKDGVRIDEFNKNFIIATHQVKDRNIVKSQLTVIQKPATYTCIASNDQNTVRSSDSYVKLNKDAVSSPLNNPRGTDYDFASSSPMCLPSINRSSYCSPYLDPSRSIYTNVGTDHVLMLEKILEALDHHLPKYNDLSPDCAPFVRPFLCYYNFPYCSGTRPTKRIVCRKDCVSLSKDYCDREFRRAKQEETIKMVIPHDCSTLPADNCISMKEEIERVKALNAKKTVPGRRAQRISVVDPTDNCFFNKGDDYRGTINVSESSLPCESWSHRKDGYVELLTGHNYCRNIDAKYERPWCYVKDRDGRLMSEFCDVPRCATPIRSQASNILYTIIPCLVFALALSLAIIMVAWKRHKQHYYQSAPSSPKQVVPRVNPKIQELNREDLCDFRLLGDGCIGRVYTADFTGCKDGKTFTACVAVKAIIEKATQKQIEDFVREAETRGNFKHDNVVALVGVISKEEPLSLVYEYTEYGDLHEYLLRHSPNFSEAHANDDNGQLEYPDLLVIATQIASGMSYLSTHAFLHKDLAARNCLVADNGVIKISDFSGLRDLYAGDYYRAPGKPPLPVRWMSPEAISQCCFTNASDVWSYGIVLWEIFSYGSRPLFGLSNYQAMKLIAEQDLLLPCPEDCSSAIFAVMQECWASEPDARPTFVEIYNRLKAMDDIMHLNTNMPLQQELSIPSLTATIPNSSDYVPREVATNAFHRPSLSSSQPHSLHSGQSSAHSTGSGHHPGSIQSASHSIPPSLLSVPHSVPSSIMINQMQNRNGHYTLPQHDGRQSLPRESHCPLSRDNRYGRPSSANSSSLHRSPIAQSNGYLPPGSYISSLQSYPTSIGCPPTMFSRQSSSRISNHESSGYDSITRGNNQANVGHVYL